MHSVHLPFQCSKVYRLHINYNMTKKETRIILLILNFKLGTVNNRKDYLQTWGEFFFFIIYFFDKTRNTGFCSKHLLCLQKFCMNSLNTTDQMNYPAWIIYMNRFFFELQMHSLKKDFYQK